MKKYLPFLVVLLFLAGCGANTSPTSSVIATPLPTENVTATPTATPTPLPPTPTPQMEYGPTNFPANINPLTGLAVENPALLERRPMAIKVSNLPRYVRPQWGLSLADIVFEYYTEAGTTRFTAIFYGRDAEMVGPIRSARFVDAHFVRGYKAIFAFGSAYEKVLDRLYSAEFADRLVIEGRNTPLYRYDPNGYDYLMVNTAALSEYITQKGIENGRQNLDGMYFHVNPPASGKPAEQFVVHYSSAIENLWNYDEKTGKYLRFSETGETLNNGTTMKYEQLTDRLTGEPIAFDNVVVMFVTNEYYNRDPEVIDILLLGSGKAYAFRDGQVYEVLWQRPAPDAVVSLTYPDGSPFPFKPGTTWFEILGMNSTLTDTGQGLYFKHLMP